MPGPLSDTQLRDLSVAMTLAPRLDGMLAPEDARTLRMVGRRFLRDGRACGMAAHEWTAVHRAADQLERAETAAIAAMAARRAAAALASRAAFAGLAG